MRCSRILLLFVSLAGLCVLATPTEAAKKKQEKMVPVKIVKPSETKYKQAKIVQKKTVERKGFLWFKKKEPKVLKQPKKEIAPETMPVLKRPRVEQKPALVPESNLVEQKEPTRVVEGVELPEKVTPEVKPAKDAARD